MCTNILRVSVRGWGRTVFGGVQPQDKAQQAQTETLEIPFEYEERLPCFEIDRTLKQAAQVGSGVSSGHIKI